MVTMNKLLFFFLFIILFSFGQTIAQVKKSITNETPAHKAERLEWFKDARFGMFIHWGLYALPARHEWVKNRERMTNEAYQKYFDNFNPDQFDPKLWAKQAKAAGMKCLAIATNGRSGKLKEAGSDMVIEDFTRVKLEDVTKLFA